jgi:hypothetical protein
MIDHLFPSQPISARRGTPAARTARGKPEPRIRLEEVVVPEDAEPGEVIAQRHRRCASAVADFYLLVIEEYITLTPAEAILEVDRIVRRVLDELHAAETTVLEALAGTGRSRPAARLLGGRLDRLRRAGIQVGAAVRAGDVPSLRRGMTSFDALARAACAVQLDVFGSAVASPRRGRTPALPVGGERRAGSRGRT